MSESWTRRVVDPDGREAVFDAGSHLHLAQGERDWLLDFVEEILRTVERPDHREDDPLPGRERFYRSSFLGSAGWLRVVVDFNQVPGWIVTALAQSNDPRLRRR